MVEDSLAALTGQKRPVRCLDDDVVRAEIAQELDKLVLRHTGEWTSRTERAEQLGRAGATKLGDDRQALLNQRREMESSHVWRLVPPFEQQLGRGDHLEQFGSEQVGRRRLLVDVSFYHVQPQGCWLAPSARPPQPLPERRHTARSADLGNGVG